MTTIFMWHETAHGSDFDLFPLNKTKNKAFHTLCNRSGDYRRGVRVTVTKTACKAKTGSRVVAYNTQVAVRNGIETYMKVDIRLLLVEYNIFMIMTICILYT